MYRRTCADGEDPAEVLAEPVVSTRCPVNDAVHHRLRGGQPKLLEGTLLGLGMQSKTFAAKVSAEAPGGSRTPATLCASAVTPRACDLIAGSALLNWASI